jgi:beta-lactamase class D
MTIYYQLDGDYYLKAFNKMEERSCIKLVEVVTDDKVHAANIIQFLHKATGVDFKLSNSDNSQLDFEKIRMARKKILSNSTFSLWAALIGGDDEIIAPSTWFIDHKVNAEYYDRTLSSLSYKIKFL